MKNIKNESGRTMLEMLGVLAIMGIIMYGAVSGINYGMSTYKVNQIYNDVQEQMEAITDLYSWSRTYKGMTMEILCENDIFAQTCDTTSYTVGHAFGGNISIEIPADGSNFTLKYEDIPQSACERLAEMEWGNISLTSTCSETGETDMTWTWKTTN